MNRTLTQIDEQKWYHLETLKKYYVDRQIHFESHRNNNNDEEFTFVRFKRAWRDILFVMHPKTKRFKCATLEALREVGFDI